MNNKLTDTAKEMFFESLNEYLISLKKDISDDILILKLSFLYNERLNNINTNEVDEIFSNIAAKIDNILNNSYLTMKESLSEVCGLFP